eukprot:4255435-Pleurochrysis_carterae.AAC.1
MQAHPRINHYRHTHTCTQLNIHTHALSTHQAIASTGVERTAVGWETSASSASAVRARKAPAFAPTTEVARARGVPMRAMLGIGCERIVLDSESPATRCTHTHAHARHTHAHARHTHAHA